MLFTLECKKQRRQSMLWVRRSAFSSHRRACSFGNLMGINKSPSHTHTHTHTSTSTNLPWRVNTPQVFQIEVTLLLPATPIYYLRYVTETGIIGEIWRTTVQHRSYWMGSCHWHHTRRRWLASAAAIAIRQTSNSDRSFDFVWRWILLTCDGQTLLSFIWQARPVWPPSSAQHTVPRPWHVWSDDKMIRLAKRRWWIAKLHSFDR